MMEQLHEIELGLAVAKEVESSNVKHIPADIAAPTAPRLPSASFHAPRVKGQSGVWARFTSGTSQKCLQHVQLSADDHNTPLGKRHWMESSTFCQR